MNSYNKRRKIGIALWMGLGGLSALMFFQQDPTGPQYSQKEVAPPVREVASDAQAPSSPVQQNLKEKTPSPPYADQLKSSLLQGMPSGTVVNIRYHSSFTPRGKRGPRDIILVETTLPDGQKHAYKASYDPSRKEILRTWGGRHDGSRGRGFTLK